MGLNFSITKIFHDHPVVPHKRDVGLNYLSEIETVQKNCRSSQKERGFECVWFSYFFWKYNVVPHKRDVGLNL